jgi:hypothetical protein
VDVGEALMRALIRSFIGGEQSPQMFSRVGDPRVDQGAAKIRNMVVTPQGTAERRNGTRFVAETKVHAETSKMVSFRFSSSQTLAVQVGAGFFRFYSNCEMLRLSSTPRTYVTSKNISAGNFNGATNEITFSAVHDLVTGDAVTLSDTGGLLPVELDVGVDYYAIVVSTTVIKLAASAADATASVAINFTTGGTESGRVHFVYERRDLVRFGSTNYYCTLRQPYDTLPTGGSPAAVTFAGNFVNWASHGLVGQTAVVFFGSGLPPAVVEGRVYYRVNGAGSAGSISISEEPGGPILGLGSGSGTGVRATHFYALTDDIYEVPNEYSESDLAELTWDSSFDILTFGSKNHRLSELRRFGTTSWEFVPVSYQQTIATPAIGSTLIEPGATTDIVSLGVTGTAIVFNADTDHQIAIGDTVIAEGVVNDSAGTPLSLTLSGFYAVDRSTAPNIFTLRTFDGGAKVQIAGVTLPYVIASPIKVRVTSLLSEQQHMYRVTAVDEDGKETLPSATQNLTNNLFVDGASNTIKWSPIAGAERYNVYKEKNGLFGFMGSVEHVDGAIDFAFVDSALANIAPDLGLTPPRFDTSLDGTDYPRAVAHFEQRRLVAGTDLFPQRLWMTRTGTNNDLSFHIPLLDDDRIVLDVASRESETIRHIIPLAQLLILTDATEYRLTPVNSDAVTPTSVAVRAQSYVGASPVQPVIVNNSLVFAAARGGHLREMGFNADAASFLTGDLSLRATHLFDGRTIRSISFSKAPYPIVWSASSSGFLLGLTYAPEEQIGAWHSHALGPVGDNNVITNGAVESCTVVEEGEEDTLYLMVKRVINGSTVRYVECLPFERAATFADNFFVDCGVSRSGAMSVVTGLDHLEGETVDAFVDGVVYRGLTVSSAQVVLPAASVSKVQLGLPMTAQVETLPLTLPVDGYGTGRTKSTDKVFLRVVDSCEFQLGPVGGLLVRRMPELSPTSAKTLNLRVTAMPKIDEDARLLIQQELPVPLTIAGVTILATAGD